MSLPQKLAELKFKREQARQRKDYELADKIREQIEEMGYLILDTKNGTKFRKRIVWEL